MSNARKLVLVLAGSLLAFGGCKSSTPAAAPPPAAPARAAAAETAKAKPAAPPKPAGPTVEKVSLADVGLDASAMDKTADPCTDFYQFACGGWLKKTEIPADRSMWSRSFSVIHEQNIKTLKDILESAAKDPGTDAGKKKIGDYYAACMDTKAIDKAGLSGIKGLLRDVRRVRSPKALAAALIALHKHKIWAVFDLSSGQDFGDATQVIANVDQNGLGLPDRDYYLKDDARSKKLREIYVAHIEKMMTLAGMKPKAAGRAASDVMKVETGLAKISMARVDRRDPHNLYHKMDEKGLERLDPSFPWARYFKALELAKPGAINVTVPAFFSGFAKLAHSLKPSVWRNYLEWHVISSATGRMALPKKFIDESFKMRQAFTGQKTIEPRWKRCVGATDRALGDLLGKIYVQEKFPGESKTFAEKLVHAISHAFDQNLDTLSWMDPATTAKAHKKLSMMVYKIGYPAKWKTYPFDVTRKSFAKDVMASAAWHLDYDLAKVGKPVDREEWYMSPPTVNAYYDPQLNEMVFPAGILQPPFYSVKSDVAVNLGGMGMIVGHELTHGFDDEGSQYAGDGNLQNWWSKDVATKFKAKTQCVADQYSKYEPVKGVHLNGKLTLGENIADIGGIKTAFHAYKALRAGAKTVRDAGGFDEDQQFFLGVGQAWCAKVRPKLAALLTKVDPHSPPRYRVNGALSANPDFGKAFGCKVGSPMRPAKACVVW